MMFKKIGHLNIADATLRRIKNIAVKKQKKLQKKKKKYKTIFKDKNGIFIIEKLTRDISERFKLPKAIELRTKIRI